MVAAREGDRSAFADLYRRYVRMVHGVLLARLPRAEVDDLVQDVFLSPPCTGSDRCARRPPSRAGWPRSPGIARSISCAGGAWRRRSWWTSRRAGRRHQRGAGDPRRGRRAARGLPRDAGAPPGGRPERGGNRGADGIDAGIGAREPASRDEDAQGAPGKGDTAVSDDYLWDRRGPADPEVARLERVLGRLRTEPPMPDWNRVAPQAGGVRHFSATYLAAAAALVVACGASLWHRARRRDGRAVVGRRPRDGPARRRRGAGCRGRAAPGGRVAADRSRLARQRRHRRHRPARRRSRDAPAAARHARRATIASRSSAAPCTR